MILPSAATPREDLILPASPLIEFIRLGLEHHAIPLTSGQPHPSCYPLDALAEIAGDVIRHEGDRYLRYGASRGMGKLRHLVDHLHTALDLLPPHRTENSLILTVGAQGGFDLLCQALLRPGDLVGIDAPCYPDTWCTVLRRGGVVRSLPVDAEGLDVENLEQILRSGFRPRMVYTVPTYQNPTGCSLSPLRSVKLLDLAERFDFLLVLDDPYRLLPLDEDLRRGKSFFPWLGWDTGRIAALGSFSKILAPGLRIGWIHTHPTLVQTLATLQEMSVISLPALDALLTAAFLERCSLEKQLHRVRRFLRERRAALLDALNERDLPDLGCAFMPCIGGCFLGLILPPGTSATTVARTLVTQHSVATVPERAFWPPDTLNAPDRFLRLSFSWATPEEFRFSAQALRTVLAP